MADLKSLFNQYEVVSKMVRAARYGDDGAAGSVVSSSLLKLHAPDVGNPSAIGTVTPQD
jgi:streptomycin 6-kinase